MDFYKEAIETLKIIVNALNGDNGIPRMRERSHRFVYKQPKTFDKKRFLSTRLKIGM